MPKNIWERASSTSKNSSPSTTGGKRLYDKPKILTNIFSKNMVFSRKTDDMEKRTLPTLNSDEIDEYRKNIKVTKVADDVQKVEMDLMKHEFLLSFNSYNHMNKKDYLPSAIQSACIPLLRRGEDMILKAPTGMGKTLCFAVPILDMIVSGEKALIIGPTRELVVQIEENIKDILPKSRTKGKASIGIASVTGKKPLLHSYSNIDIIVATPGRLLDCLVKKLITLDNLKYLVLDEADVLIDYGFGKSILDICEFFPDKEVSKQISQYLPKPSTIQRVLVSATFTEKVNAMVNKLFGCSKQYYHIEYNEVIQEHIKQSFYGFDSSSEKLDALLSFLCSCNFQSSWSDRIEDLSKVIIFIDTKKECEETYQIIQRKSALGEYDGKLARISLDRIHSDRDQFSRHSTMDKYKKNILNVLIATSVASRGIHVDGISHVINFNTPSSLEEYIHRIGRTGRQGHEGCAITYYLKSKRGADGPPPLSIEDLIKGTDENKRFTSPSLGFSKSKKSSSSTSERKKRSSSPKRKNRAASKDPGALQGSDRSGMLQKTGSVSAKISRSDDLENCFDDKSNSSSEDIQW